MAPFGGEGKYLGNMLPMSRPAPPFASAAAAAEAGGPHADAVRLFRLLNVVGTQLRRLSDARFRGESMTTRQATLITIAKGLGQPSLSEIAAVMSTSHQNVKQIALGLVRRGFARIVTDAADSRVRRLVVTRKSDRFWAARDADDAAAIAHWFSALTAKDLATLNRLLEKLSHRLANIDSGGPSAAK